MYALFQSISLGADEPNSFGIFENNLSSVCKIALQERLRTQSGDFQAGAGG